MPERGETRLLAQQMRLRRDAGEEPFVLVLGAGASIRSGAPLTETIITKTLQDWGNRDPTHLSKEERLAEFYEILDNLSDNDRYLWLAYLFKGAQPSPGYVHLAQLMRSGFFNVVLSTNFDTLLDDGLQQLGLLAQDLKVFVVNGDECRQIKRQMEFPNPRLKVLKLHGDLPSRIIKFTPEETDEFPNDIIKELVSDLLSKDLVIVGHSIRDQDLVKCFPSEGGNIWYVDLFEPAASSNIRTKLNMRKGSCYIAGEKGDFDTFFRELFEYLMGRFSLQEPDDAELPQDLLREIKAVLERVEGSIEEIRAEMHSFKGLLIDKVGSDTS